jgi:hypothetical protein
VLEARGHPADQSVPSARANHRSCAHHYGIGDDMFASWRGASFARYAKGDLGVAAQGQLILPMRTCPKLSPARRTTAATEPDD